MIRRLLGLAAPFLLANVLNLAVLAADRIWIGQVGTNALAGLGLAHAALMICFTLILGPAIGTLGGVARHIGAGRHEQAERVCGQGVFISLCVGVFFAIGAIFLPEAILSFMGSQANVSPDTHGYLTVSLAALGLNAPLFALTFAIQGAGDARTALIIQAVAPLLNGILEPLFIFVFDWGLVGAAWASAVGYAGALTIGIFLAMRPSARIRFRPAYLPFHRKVASEVISVGVPGTFEQLVRTSALFLLVWILAQFGEIVLSAYTATIIVTLLLVSPGLALGQATAALMGQNLGAGKPDRAWRTAWLSVLLYTVFMSLCLVVFWYFAHPLIRVFDQNPQVVEMGGPLLRIMTWSFPAVAIALILSKAFAGASKTAPPMIAAALAHLAFQIPCASYWCSVHGPEGAYWAMTAAFYLHAGLNVALFWRLFSPSRAGNSTH